VPPGRVSGPENEPVHSGPGAEPTSAGVHRIEREHTRPRNYYWAELMQRVFKVDVLECPECGSTMRILAAIHPPEATRAILGCLGLPSRAPPLAPARPASRISPRRSEARPGKPSERCARRPRPALVCPASGPARRGCGN
jgi:hypothetical protein